MQNASSNNAKKPMEQPSNGLSKSMEQLSVSTDDSDKTSTPPKNLSDMPVDVVSLIIERSDYKQQLILRKVSKSLRALVDNQKPACKSIELSCYAREVYITFNNDTVIYAPIQYDDDFVKTAFDDLAATLKNPKLQLEEFSIAQNVCEEHFEKYRNEIRCILELLNRELSVKKVELHVSNPSTLLAILPYLKPGFLEKISLHLQFSVDRRNDPMDKIALLEQWKQAEELELQYCFDRFPMEYAKHFKRFRFEELMTNGDKFIRIRDFLFNLDNFEHCTLSYYTLSSDPNFVYELLGEPVFKSTTEEVFHHFIPDSDYYFEIKQPSKLVVMSIEKKKREIH